MTSKSTNIIPTEMYQTTFVRAWVKKILQEHVIKVQEANDIGALVQDLRIRSNRPGNTGGMYIAFWGFAGVKARNCLLRGIRYALRPRLIYVSQNKSMNHLEIGRTNYFEGIMCIPHGILSVDDLEALMSSLHASMGIADLDSFMSDAMVTCLERISNGEYVYGNWLTAQNAYWRDLYFTAKRVKGEKEAQQHLFSVTGLNLTTGNMLSLWHSRQNLRIDLVNIRQSMGIMSTVLEADHHISTMNLELIFSLPGEEGRRVRQMNTQHSNNNMVIQNHVNSLLHSTSSSSPVHPIPQGTFSRHSDFGGVPPPPPPGPGSDNLLSPTTDTNLIVQGPSNIDGSLPAQMSVPWFIMRSPTNVIDLTGA